MKKKVTIELNLEEIEDEIELKRYLTANDAYMCLREIADQIFRPARKHGYSDAKINKVLEDKEADHEDVIAVLEEKFFDILRENNVSLDYW